MKSVTSIKQSDIQEKWYLVDATGYRIGNLASKVAELLQSKNNPMVREYHEPMTKVIVINASKIDFTEKRGMTKFFRSYSGYPGGLRFISLEEIFKTHPEKPIEIAVKGMLPKTKRGRAMIANLKVFANETHPHEAQQPEVIDLRNTKF